MTPDHMMNQTVVVKTRLGDITGVKQETVCRFSAIPFAQAPIGSLRFHPPVPVQSVGMLDATRPGPVPPQRPSRLSETMGDFVATQSEDCLHLTVWTPAPDAKRRPVVVWLHGGAWVSGGGALDWYDGTALAERGDIVVVAPNYRLGALGWLHVPGVTANLGLLDQEAAVAWVAEHIDAFGGDPERITVMGQSAGGACIAAMLSRRPRFNRAIMQSASLGRGFRSVEGARQLGALFMDTVQAADLQDLQALPVETLLAAQQTPALIEALKAEGANRTLFCPVADGDVIDIDWQAALREASGRADVLIGYTQHEMAAFPGMTRGASSERLGDTIYGAPARQWAADALAHGRSALMYRFDFEPTTRFGACHCIELPFVFGTFDAFAKAPMLGGMQCTEADRLTSKLQKLWIDFIRDEAQHSSSPHIHVLV
ncbi:MAG: carboxylesterase family protein [Pusillimonas sp.]